MNGLAALLALALAQGAEPSPPGAVAAERPAEAPPLPTGPAREPEPLEKPAAAERAEPPAPAEKPSAARPEVKPAPAPEPAARPPPRPGRPPRALEQPPAAPGSIPPQLPAAATGPGPAGKASPTPTPARPATPPAAASALPASPAPPAAAPDPERAQVAAAALKFLEALLSRRAADLAARCAPDFSFDGGAAGGAEDVRSRWSEALASHDGVTYVLYGLEVLPAAEAVARFGKAPRRVAGLLRPGSWVALANLSGRPTFVFFARQGADWVATGLHD